MRGKKGSGGLLPLCQTCRVNRVHVRRNRFCSQACVPRAERVAWCRKGNATQAYRRRALQLRRHLDRLNGRIVTREDLLAVLSSIRKEGYLAGYRAGVKKWGHARAMACDAA